MRSQKFVVFSQNKVSRSFKQNNMSLLIGKESTCNFNRITDTDVVVNRETDKVSKLSLNFQASPTNFNKPSHTILRKEDGKINAKQIINQEPQSWRGNTLQGSQNPIGIHPSRKSLIVQVPLFDSVISPKIGVENVDL